MRDLGVQVPGSRRIPQRNSWAMGETSPCLASLVSLYAMCQWSLVNVACRRHRKSWRNFFKMFIFQFCSAPPNISKKMADEEIPTSIGDYLVLALSLPTLPAYPKPATHYLYLRQHAPKVPTADDARVLFLVNVPIDATEEHFKHLFETQLEAGAVESVKFEGQRSRKKPAIAPAVAGKKRKRGQAGRAELPDVWDRDLHASGSTALVVFAEEKGARRVLKTVKSLKGGAVGWGDGMEEQEPLGSARERSSCHEELHENNY